MVMPSQRRSAVKHSIFERRVNGAVRRFGTSVVWLICLLAVVVVPTYAQFSSAIQGIATDPSGAVVPDATITLTNVSTGVTQTADTNATGSYYFPNLPPGKYKVEAKATGFQSIVQENVA